MTGRGSMEAFEGKLGPILSGGEENPVIRRLAINWERRATVKRDDPDLLELFDVGLPDYPEGIVPFRDHPIYQGLAPDRRMEILTWAMIALNRNTIFSEQHVVNPAFSLILKGEFPGLWGHALEISLMQSMVDEQYHSLMHRIASGVMRQRRNREYNDELLPLPHYSRVHQDLNAKAEERWQRSLLTLAFATITELCIGGYLELIAKAPGIQPMNVALAKLHRHDEVCHGSINGELVEVLFPQLTRDQQDYLLEALCRALEAYAANDYGTWRTILRIVDVPGSEEMLREVQSGGRRTLFRDYSGLYRVFEHLEVLDRIEFDWSNVRLSGEIPYE